MNVPSSSGIEYREFIARIGKMMLPPPLALAISAINSPRESGETELIGWQTYVEVSGQCADSSTTLIPESSRKLAILDRWDRSVDTICRAPRSVELALQSLAAHFSGAYSSDTLVKYKATAMSHREGLGRVRRRRRIRTPRCNRVAARTPMWRNRGISASLRRCLRPTRTRVRALDAATHSA